MLESGAKTDKGNHRGHNEDACLIMEKEQVYIVADGVGGNRAGELASRTAVNEVADFLRRNRIDKTDDRDELARILTGCVKHANDSILKLGDKYPENKGMATTLVICIIKKDKAYFVNVGDSRAYIRRGSELFQLTEDHSYVNSLIKLGVITRDEAADRSDGNVITKAIGAEKEVEADYYQTNITEGDVLILCTDGLYGEVKEKDINECITENTDMEKLACRLVDKANEAGGRDNISVVCIKITVKGGKNE
ncbi:MAG: Stp1/IreP family PP2C-type Ser/Thr phosphatase [Eubacteriaceae bacterium]|nr:Stp1/IreP family PP2C-type Ser/Thr phosphatase [Eubacteriaceae bacterium]